MQKKLNREDCGDVLKNLTSMYNCDIKKIEELLDNDKHLPRSVRRALEDMLRLLTNYALKYDGLISYTLQYVPEEVEDAS